MFWKLGRKFFAASIGNSYAWRLASLAVLLACLLAGSSARAALFFTPATTPVFTTDENSALNGDEVADLVGLPHGVLTEVYKQNAGGSEEKSFAGSYTTSIGPSGDFANATISYDGEPDPTIQYEYMYLLVKDGNSSPNQFIYDIGPNGFNWDGIEDLVMTGYFPGTGRDLDKGSISHVSIYAGGDPIDDEEIPVPAVPEPASLAIWLLGVAGVGLVAHRRRKSLAAM